jgi:glycosyltransferase involved in cell wall biosynthesis
MQDGPRTAIVIPAFNEEEALPTVLKTLAERVPDYQVVVVDDGSTDRTSEVASAAGVVCLKLPFNLGIGGALRAGFRYAVEHDFDRAVQFDADGQHDADQIDSLLAGLDEGADMIIGSRFSGDSGYKVGFARGGAMGALRVATRLLTGQRFSDTSSGFRAISRPLLDDFAREYPVEYMDSVETLVTACRDGYDVREVPTTMHVRAGGAPSTRNYRLAYHYARLVVVMLSRARRNKPRPMAQNGEGDDSR